MKLLNKEVPIRAHIDEMNDLSAHGGKRAAEVVPRMRGLGKG